MILYVMVYMYDANPLASSSLAYINHTIYK